MKPGDLVRCKRHPETNSIGVVVDIAWDGTPVIFYGVPDKDWGEETIWEMVGDLELIYEAR